MSPAAATSIRFGSHFSSVRLPLRSPSQRALTAAGPQVIEFNVRFGDPDVQPVLALLESPLGGLLMAAAQGDLSDGKWEAVAGPGSG